MLSEAKHLRLVRRILLRAELRDQNDIGKKEDSRMPYYQKLGEIPRKHHIWFHRNGADPVTKTRASTTST